MEFQNNSYFDYRQEHAVLWTVLVLMDIDSDSIPTKYFFSNKHRRNYFTKKKNKKKNITVDELSYGNGI